MLPSRIPNGDAEGVAAEVLRMFADRGGSQYGGEGVSQLEHGLQAALLAEEEGAPSTLVVAALLHDVGHLLHDLPDDAPDNGVDDLHETLGAEWLVDRFPPDVLEPVRLHVEAKRYLCATEPGYWEALSEPSKVSLELQGGRMSPDECAAFRSGPHFDASIRLRRWDDLAKVVGLRTPPLEHFVPAIVECSTAQRHAVYPPGTAGPLPARPLGSNGMADRVAVVGAGIVGVAHAWREATRGSRVTLFERHQAASGASVRNFGMVWPIGQPPERREVALRSRALWDEFIRETGVWSSPAGSLHVATRADELHVLEEFADTAPADGYDCRLLSAAEAAAACPAADHAGVLGALHSPTELGVDPREVLARAPLWLAEQHGVVYERATPVRAIDLPTVESADGRRWEFDRAIVATGADFATLYPEAFARRGLSVCKLMMMRTGPQPGAWRIGPMIASGLTLRHYPSFERCASLGALRERIADETPELDRYGIHVMAAQNGLGEVVLGDSHEYGDAAEPFDNAEIERLILRELERLIVLPSWRLDARWHGVYAVQPRGGVEHREEVADGVTVAIATGGAGMTMSFGLAEQAIAADRPPGRRSVVAGVLGAES